MEGIGALVGGLILLTLEGKGENNMRMWMVDPRIMCRQHLLGEHLENHMFVRHLVDGKGIDGYLRNNCLEVRSLYPRHNDLVYEMTARGYKHKSPFDLETTEMISDNYSDEQLNVRIDKEEALKELLRRCKRCRERRRLWLEEEK